MEPRMKLCPQAPENPGQPDRDMDVLPTLVGAEYPSDCQERLVQEKGERIESFSLWLPGLGLNTTVWYLSFLAGEIKCYK